VRGRKPVPTVLKIARGNPGQRRLPDDEPQPSTEIDLAVPAELADHPDASREWERIAPMLHRLGLLSEADRDGLVFYCSAYARWQEAERQLRRYGLLITAKGNPYPMISPYLSISNKAQAQCRLLLMEFGLTPVSRSRVHLPKKQAVDAQRDRFFGPSSSRLKPA
jgi:P27 family predicted phage terminase small subunit